MRHFELKSFLKILNLFNVSHYSFILILILFNIVNKNSFSMTHCYQVKFSLNYDPVILRNQDHYIPTKTRHSSFIMRLKSNAKTKITKYHLAPRRQSLFDELSVSLNAPIPRQFSEKSKDQLPDFLKLNITHLGSSIKKQQSKRFYHSPLKTTNAGFERRKRFVQKTQQKVPVFTEEPLNITQVIYVDQSCPLYTPKSELTPRKAMVSSHARIRTVKPKPYQQFYGDQKSQQNLKIMIAYYRDFMWKVAFSNQHQLKVIIEKPRVYIGKGNNSRLVKSVMKSRWWWALEKDECNSNFSWTQLKISSIYVSQKQAKKTTLPLKPIQSMIEGKLKGDPAISIMNQNQLNQWNSYFKVNQKLQKRINQNLDCRKNLSKQLKIINVEKVSNHLEMSRMIGNKKALFYTMKQYYQLSKQDYRQYIPLTYHIVSGTQDQQYTSFLKAYSQNRKTGKLNMWIVKPGELSNRGNGIKVCSDLNQIRQILKSKATHNNGRQKTYIVQQYLSEPFLYKARKFDIRHYIMVTSVDGIIKGYWYQQGYIRTTSSQYNINQLGGFIHLTNDAVQKYSKDYGKYEKGNKLSYADFQVYLDEKHGKGAYVFSQVLERMKKVATDAIKAAYLIIDPKRRQHNFQIFGLDFMIDSQFNPWLIQCNTNPCLQLSSPLLAKLIPSMLDNALRIGLDPLFPPPPGTYPIRKVPIDTNRFQLVFDQLRDCQQIQSLYFGKKSVAEFLQDIGSDDEAYEDKDQQDDD